MSYVSNYQVCLVYVEFIKYVDKNNTLYMEILKYVYPFNKYGQLNEDVDGHVFINN